MSACIDCPACGYGLTPTVVVPDLTYAIAGRPVTWQRTNDVKGRHVVDVAQREAKRVHQLRALAALGRARAAWSLDGAFAIGVLGYWPDAVVGDVDRLVGLAMDAGQGLLWHQDRQVRELLRCAVLIDRERPRVEVTVRRIAETVEPKRRKAKVG